MAATQSQLDALDSAIASGELRVIVEGRNVEYRSISDLLSARRFLADQLAASTATVARTHPRYQVARFDDQ